MKTFVTGAAGFIGSTLAERLLAEGNQVVVWDNFSTGKSEFLECARQNKDFRLIKGDNLDLPSLTQAMDGCAQVVHLAADADVRLALGHPCSAVHQDLVPT